jgi:hypothetical protein
MNRSVAALVVLAWASAAGAREGEFKCEDKETVVQPDDRVTFHCRAWIVSDTQLALLLRKDESTADLVKLLLDRRQLSDSVSTLQLQLVDSAKRIGAINEAAYVAVKEKYGELDKVTAASIENTREAVKLARSIRRASYFTSALLGGGMGAYLGHQVGNGWQPATAGAAIGAVVGFAANWAVLRLTGLD